METMLHEWLRPEQLRKIPQAPKLQPTSADIEKIAALLANAKCPVISVENAGPDQKAFDALVELAELLAIPVIESPGAFFANFPKSHDLYLGANITPLLAETDLALLVEEPLALVPRRATRRRTRRSWRSARTRSRPTWFTR
jgi:acetolactate synthase-1/2/3 large subunit